MEGARGGRKPATSRALVGSSLDRCPEGAAKLLSSLVFKSSLHIWERLRYAKKRALLVEETCLLLSLPFVG